MTYLAQLIAQTSPLIATRTSRLSPQVSTALIEYASHLPLSTKQQEAVEMATSGHLTIVATGQQVGILLNPMLVIYKAATAILLAEAIAKQTNSLCLPLFWLQTEDHDLKEISGAALPPLPSAELHSESVRFAIRWPEQTVEALNRKLVADIELPDQIGELTEQAAVYLKQLPNGGPLSETIRHCYRPGRPIADAFAELLSGVFAEYPLLLFHPRLGGIPQASAALIRASSDRYSELSDALQKHFSGLSPADAAASVHIRPNSPLFFYTPNGSAERFRLERNVSKQNWRVIAPPGSYVPEAITDDELNTSLSKEPERFSSSALLRPIIQNYLLPTIAYVGGPTELIYSNQVAVIAPLLSQPTIPVVERFSACVIESKIQEIMLKIGLTSSDIAQGYDHCRNHLLQQGTTETITDSTTLLRLVDVHLSEIIDPISQAVTLLDPTLATPLEKTRVKCEEAFQSFLKRYDAAIERSRITEFSRLDRIFAALSPGELDQERAYSPLYFLGKYGEDFIKTVLTAFASAPTSRIEITL